MIVRAVHLAFEAPGAESAQATLFYPGDDARVDEARMTGFVPPDASGGRRPVAVLIPGVNIAPRSYQWLAERLVAKGFCAVTYSTIGPLGPAGSGISPGIDMSALTPDVIGQRPSANALGPLLSALSGLDRGLDAVVDLGRIALVGHSAGGTVALHNARPDWFPGVGAAVTFGSHTMTARALGHGDATVAPVPSEVPLALIHGALDGVIEASRERYRSDDAEHDPVGQTFEHAVSSERGDCWLLTLPRANHFAMCHPVDETSGRSFLETELRADDLETREVLARAVVSFLRSSLIDADDYAALQAMVDAGEFSRWRRR